MRLPRKTNILTRIVNNQKINGYLDYKGKYLFTDTCYGCVLTDRHDMPKSNLFYATAENINKMISAYHGKDINDLTDFDSSFRDYQIDVAALRACFNHNEIKSVICIGSGFYNPIYVYDLACLLRPDDVKRGTLLVHALPKEDPILWLYGYNADQTHRKRIHISDEEEVEQICFSFRAKIVTVERSAVTPPVRRILKQWKKRES